MNFHFSSFFMFFYYFNKMYTFVAVENPSYVTNMTINAHFDKNILENISIKAGKR
ncbi:hypothetical protein NCCP2050_18350 [Planococcus sp. NCCP-2050]|nr:hypothetical protein NCCP2050_18350 [Planococcus sp. NCCP-2050]